MLAAILAIFCGVGIYIWCSGDNAPSDSSRKEVRIAIAWRADADNEFCTNIVEAFREAGVTVTVLPQVKAGYLDYSGDAVAATCLDADGIGYLSEASGALVRSRGYDGSNAAEVLSGVDGVMIGRGAMGNPWIFREIKARMRGETPPPVSLDERYDVYLDLNPVTGEQYFYTRRYYDTYFDGISGTRLYAMTWPNRGVNPAEPLDLLTCPPLTFAPPDRETFSCLRLAEEAAEEGGTACAILNGANEAAVELFLAERIGFSRIAELVAAARAAVPVVQDPSLEEILAADRAAREAVAAAYQK